MQPCSLPGLSRRERTSPAAMPRRCLRSSKGIRSWWPCSFPWRAPTSRRLFGRPAKLPTTAAMAGCPSRMASIPARGSARYPDHPLSLTWRGDASGLCPQAWQCGKRPTLRLIAGHGHRHVPSLRNTDQLQPARTDASKNITNINADTYPLFL